MDCKRALVASDRDVERAKDWLREHGVAKAAAKEHRTTNEGVVEAYLHGVGGMPPKVGVLIEVDCESDFVAKTDDFKSSAASWPFRSPAPTPSTSDPRTCRRSLWSGSGASSAPRPRASRRRWWRRSSRAKTKDRPLGRKFISGSQNRVTIRIVVTPAEAGSIQLVTF